uniref:WAP domain-containing protein n=1 Tax=Hucho hucho TaxID=62062 RepID=A0A4W5KYC3_9TELE
MFMCLCGKMGSLTCLLKLCCPKAKPGVCPHRRWGVGTCAELCSNDSDCPNDEKCCHNGCGHDCIAPYTATRGNGECYYHRAGMGFAMELWVEVVDRCHPMTP